MSLLAAYAPSDTVLFVARVVGGLAAGMAYPTTLALITALWSGAGADEVDRAVVGHRRRDLGARPAALGAPARALLTGARCSCSRCRSRWSRSCMAWRYVPAHVNEATEPVDNLGGDPLARARRRADPRDQLRAGPERGDADARARGDRASPRSSLFYLRQRRARNPLYDLEVAARPTFWVAACAGIIVFGSLMGAMFIGQQFLQNVLGYSTLDAGLSILPAAFCMVLVAPRSAKLVEARGARFTLLFGYVFVLLGFLTMLLLWKEGIPYWKVGLGYALRRDRRRARRHARLALAHRLGPGQARRDGVGNRRPPARPRRRDHAVDLRRAADRRLRRGRGHADRSSGKDVTREHPGRADEVVLERRRHRRAVPDLDPGPDHRAARRPPSCRATSGPTRPASSPSLLGAVLVFFCFPKASAREQLLADYQAEDLDTSQENVGQACQHPPRQGAPDALREPAP